MEAISNTEQFVMAGSMDSFHEYFDPFFILAVYLTAPSHVRVTRVHQREYEEFGERVLEGGDMFQAHQQFLEDVARYEIGGGSTSRDVHEKWAASLSCEVLRLDGSKEISENANLILNKYQGLCTL